MDRYVIIFKDGRRGEFTANTSTRNREYNQRMYDEAIELVLVANDKTEDDVQDVRAI